MVKSRSLFRNQKGQLIVEFVLLLALTVGIISLVTATFRQRQYMAMFVAKPWTSIRSMIQNANWDPKKAHPASARANRIMSVEGDSPQ
jgi:hypothetical protein